MVLAQQAGRRNRERVRAASCGCAVRPCGPGHPIELAAVMGSLRSFEGHPLLKAGLNDSTEAARGAALFAFRKAAYESLLERPGFWCRAVRIYQAGHWPMGLMPDSRL